jgi:hypothetical protein
MRERFHGPRDAAGSPEASAEYHASMTVVYFRFLDEVRRDGKINMFGAFPVLAEAFGLSPSHARRIWGAWSKTFSRDASVEERAARAAL